MTSSRQVKLLIALGAAFVPDCASAPHVWRGPNVSAPAGTPRGRLLAVMPKVEERLIKEVKSAEIPSLVVGVVQDGELVWSRGFGFRDKGTKDPVTADTVYRVASITKVVTAMAILALRDERKLALDDPVERYLPELASVPLFSTDSPKTTIRHLMSHTSGLPRDVGEAWFSPPSEAELFAAIKKEAKYRFAPATKYMYSNLGYALLGLVVARVAKEPYTAFVKRRILAPLGMSGAAWEEEAVPAVRLATGYMKRYGHYVPTSRWVSGGANVELGAAVAAGGLYASLNDLVRLARFQLAAWPPRDDAENGPLKRSTVRESHLLMGPGGIGGAWHVRVRDRFYGHVVQHGGSVMGFRAEMYVALEHKLAVILLTGAWVGFEPIRWVVGALEDAVKAERPKSIRKATP